MHRGALGGSRAARALVLALLSVLAAAPSVPAHGSVYGEPTPPQFIFAPPPMPPPAGPADTPQSARRHFRSVWKQGVSALVMVELQALSAFDHPVTVTTLLEVLGSGELGFYPIARRVLGGFREPETLDKLVRDGVGSRNPDVRAQTLLALGEGRPVGIDWLTLTEAALDDPYPQVRAAAVFALGRARISTRLDRILDLATDRSERVRVEIPDALVRLSGERALPVLSSLARDERWRVRLAAARGLADLKTRKGTAALIDMLAAERGRVREDVLEQLRRLTGRAFGLDVARWRRFLDEAPEDFLARADSAVLDGPLYAGGIRYYSVTTTSQRFVLLTDLSGSMQAPVVIRVGAYGNDGGAGTQQRPRLDVAQDELIRLVDGLDPEVWFGLATFADKGRTWRKELVVANPRNRSTAKAEIARYRAEGGTNVFEALELLFDQADVAIDAPIPKDEDLDTIFFLTDGTPTLGHITNADLSLDYVAERNRTTQLCIHCLSLTTEPNARHFLERLATLTGGTYESLVVDG